MKTFKTKKISAVQGFGTCGYRVEFSVLDLYRLNELAARAYNPEDPNVVKLCSVIEQLFAATVNSNDESKFDFLEKTEVEQPEQ